MQLNSNDITTLFPAGFSLPDIRQLSAMEPFCEAAIDFFDQLSKRLNKDPRTRAYPDVATFAFFCRKSNLLKIKEQYDTRLLLGRGVVFHIAPSNVPVNFAYSLLCGVLAGNINIVRVSSKDFEQVAIICNAMAAIRQAGIHNEITERIFIVRYDRQSDATALYSSLCDVRVIWGGDDTIAQIRRHPLPARSFDITFADRYSICVINADIYCNESHPETVANGFYNDTFLFDQNACTAPHLIVWMGDADNIAKSKTVFWDTLYRIVKSKYGEIQDVIAIDKLTALYNEAVHVQNIKKIPSKDNLLWRIELETLPKNIDEFRSTCGYFTEYTMQSLAELKEIINRKYQTLAYYGFSADFFTDFIRKLGPSGIDRIVPIGHTMDFSMTWDGFDLIKTLSRKIAAF
jgi:hypothetical protein